MAHQHFWIYNQQSNGWIDEPRAAIRRNFLPADLKPQRRRTVREAFSSSSADARRNAAELERRRHTIPSFLESSAGSICVPRVARRNWNRSAENPKLVGIRHIVQDEPDNFRFNQIFGRYFYVGGIRSSYDILFTPEIFDSWEFVKRFGAALCLDHLAKTRSRVAPLNCGRASARTVVIPNVVAKVPDWLRKPAGNPGGEDIRPIWTWRSNALDPAA